MSLAQQANRTARYRLSYTALVIMLAVAIVPALFLIVVAMADPLLTERSEPVEVDTVVVLGGDGPARAAKAADLWSMGLARGVVVAGDGDCTFIAGAMIDAGVPASAVSVDCLSRNTWENALYSAALLEQAGTHSAILVTSWFHTRRAMAVFRAVCPGIEWVSVPTEPPGSLLSTALGHYGPAVAKEYVKAVLYRLTSLVSPFGEPPPGSSCIANGRLS